MGFVINLETSTLSIASDNRIKVLKAAFSKVVVYNKLFRKKGLGLALWIPPRVGTLTTNIAAYRLLNFNTTTNWGATLESLHAAAGTPDVVNRLALQ